ncbi:Transcription elongation factor SPT4-B [Chionoecetes opilio]|uniref:Transcription elongation factor SPT4-B n=1 Tax=Chionoecetes opilio TaxID=41210 RepID=A0A8J4XV36_CHIOP|nr:Transcription elongation factor SPT4-B [Chionoecetes opilio]
MDSLSGSIWRCRYLCRRTKIWIFKSLVIPVLLYGCETWTLNSDFKRRINAFDKCVQGIYAISITGRLPHNVVREMKTRGFRYRSRDMTKLAKRSALTAYNLEQLVFLKGNLGRVLLDKEEEEGQADDKEEEEELEEMQ